MKNFKRDNALEKRLEHHLSGRIWVKGYYKNGKEYGLWEHYKENGQAWYMGEFKNGSRIGLHYESWIS
jgi:antitoxin component YwqK of YwqJK toxin-antitoxin module